MSKERKKKRGKINDREGKQHCSGKIRGKRIRWRDNDLWD